MAVDLHMHTNFSDGTLSPEALVKHALANGLDAIAVTDHDIARGNAAAIRFGKKYGLEVVPGVELSIDCKLPNSGHMHILGLFIDYENRELNESLDFLRNERDRRNHKILAVLKELNMPLTMEELLEEAGEGSVGRPHIARLMQKHGYVKDYQEAFDRYLKKGAPAYMDKVKLDEKQGLELIKNAGGLAILAHPMLMNFDSFEEMGRKILELRPLGLDGFEAYYSLHSPEITTWLENFAVEHDFLISGGSDFHGENKPDIKIRTGKGNLDISNKIYDNLKKYHQNAILQ